MNKKFHDVFEFLDWKLDVHNFQLSLSYRIETVGVVTEVLSLPPFDGKMLKQRIKALNNACELIHLLCGVSYYKAGLAQKVTFINKQPSTMMADFIQKTWFHGLAEMAYENNVSLKNRLNFEYQPNKSKTSTTMQLNNRALVPIGGGKDSLVTVEMLKEQGKDFDLFMVGQSPLIKEMAAFIDKPLVQVKRKIDAKLIQYNKDGAYNGHVPITAINSAIAVLCAILYDYDSIVFSNEKSADSANTTNSDGDHVNHQYSKSYAFEQDITRIIDQEISPNLSYFSLLRPFSELAIVQKFSQYSQYFTVFSSCNRNFHIDGSKNKNTRWCGDCPKCRFVFLALAPFIDKSQLLGIFGHNLLDDRQQQSGFAQLLGLEGFKPFECVGEIQESQLAFNMIMNHTDWSGDELVEAFRTDCPVVSDQQKDVILQGA